VTLSPPLSLTLPLFEHLERLGDRRLIGDVLQRDSHPTVDPRLRSDPQLLGRRRIPELRQHDRGSSAGRELPAGIVEQS